MAKLLNQRRLLPFVELRVQVRANRFRIPDVLGVCGARLSERCPGQGVAIRTPTAAGFAGIPSKHWTATCLSSWANICGRAIRGRSMTRFFVQNFGCRATQADGAALEAQLAERGLAGADARENADLVILNTCTVTAAADRRRAADDPPGASRKSRRRASWSPVVTHSARRKNWRRCRASNGWSAIRTRRRSRN